MEQNNKDTQDSMVGKLLKMFSAMGDFSGKLLISAAIVALVIANTSLGTGLEQAIDAPFIGNLDFRYFINDVLMAIFFLLVGLEIKREVVKGELSSFKNASLPIYGAFGGVALPALIYFLFNKGLDTEGGWAIPMATDIAFSLTIIMLLKGIIPNSLRIVLATLAVVDDVIGIVVIAIFYSSNVVIEPLLYALGVVVVLIVFNFMKVKLISLYLLGGIFIWHFFHEGGIHPTLSGVVTALCIPANLIYKNNQTPLEVLEHALTKPVSYLIMPLFAFVNTNIPISIDYIFEPNLHLFGGIFLGLLLGKPIGILTITYLMVTLKLSRLPKGVGWKHMLGMGMLAGIGFTVAIFIAILSFPTQVAYLAEAKIYIILASLFSALLGYFYLKTICKSKLAD